MEHFVYYCELCSIVFFRKAVQNEEIASAVDDFGDFDDVDVVVVVSVSALATSMNVEIHSMG
jgi:hypothetical protein